MRPLVSRCALGGCLAALVTLTVAQQHPVPEAEKTRILVNWLTCEECMDGQLEALRSIKPPPVEELRHAYLNGPTAATREGLRKRLEARYSELARSPHGPAVDASAERQRRFADHYAANFVNSYRNRAAEGLVLAGGPKGRQALADAYCQIWKSDDPEDRRAIRAALRVMEAEKMEPPSCPGSSP